MTHMNKIDASIGDGRSKVEVHQSTGKQLVAIIFILALATKMFLLEIYLIRATGRDAYIAMAISCGIDLITLGAIIATLYASKKANMFELLTSTIGNVGAKIVSALLTLFFFLKLNIAVAEILAFYGNNVLSDFDTSFMIILLSVFFISVGNHTLRALLRLNELLVPIIAVCLSVLIAIVVMTGFDLANIFPAVRDASTFGEQTVRHFAWVGDFTPLLLFVGRTKTEKFTGAFAAGAGVIGAAVAVFFALVMSAAFGNVPLLVDSTTNFSSILQFSMGNVYGRIDLFSSILWSISVFIEAALLFYATCRCFAFVIGKNAHFAIAIGAAVLMYAVQVFAFTDQTIFAKVVSTLPVSLVVSVFSLIAPVFVLCCAVAHRKKESKNNEDQK